MINSLSICCPLCKGLLSQENDALNCTLCGKAYPIISGIPDLRVFGDPYLGFEDDYRRTRLIAENINRFDLAGLLKFYWSNSPETPDSLRGKFVRAALLGEAKAKEILKSLPQSRDDMNHSILEIGCGTGGFLVPASKRYKSIVGVDIALRWLTICKKRLEESSIEIPLICCCAEYLPFPDNCFDRVIACATIEHTQDQNAVLSESHRVLKRNGTIFISTPNRFSISVEPHVYLWGVGFLPRKLMGLYVKLFKGVEYKNKRLLSYFELNKLFLRFKDVKFSFPDIDDASITQFTPWEKLQALTYRKIRKLSIFKAFLLLFGPVYYVFGRK